MERRFDYWNVSEQILELFLKQNPDLIDTRCAYNMTLLLMALESFDNLAKKKMLLEYGIK